MKTALILVDLQNDYFPDGTFAKVLNSEDIISRMVA